MTWYPPPRHRCPTKSPASSYPASRTRPSPRRPVVKDQEKGAAMGSPAASFTPLIVAVYFVELASAEDGVSVAVSVELL